MIKFAWLFAALALGACATNAAPIATSTAPPPAIAPASNVPLANAYVINFRNFSRSEIDYLTDALEVDFPAQLQVESVSGPAENRLVNVLTPVAGHKLENFLHTALMQMGVVEDSVSITVRSDNRFIVDRVMGLPKAAPKKRYSYE